MAGVFSLDGDLAVVLRDQQLGLEGSAAVVGAQEDLHDLSHVSVGHEGNVVVLQSGLDHLGIARRRHDLEGFLMGLRQSRPLLLERATVRRGIRVQREHAAHTHVIASSTAHIEVHEVVEAAHRGSGRGLRGSHAHAHVHAHIRSSGSSRRFFLELASIGTLVVVLLHIVVAEIGHHELLGGDEVGSGLLVEHRERVELGEERVDQLLVHVHEALHSVLRRVNDLLRRVDVVRQQAVVHVHAIRHIGRRVVLGQRLEQTAQHRLHLRSTAEEQLDRGGQQLQTHADVLLLLDVVDQRLHDVGSIRAEVGEGADQPQAGSAAVGILGLAQNARHVLHDLLSVLGMLAQHVLHHDDGLRADVVDIDVEELDQGLEAASVRLVQQDSELADGADGLAGGRFGRSGDVLLQLVQDIHEVLAGSQHGEDLNLEMVDEGGLDVSAEELAVLVLERVLAATHQQLHV